MGGLTWEMRESGSIEGRCGGRGKRNERRLVFNRQKQQESGHRVSLENGFRERHRRLLAQRVYEPCTHIRAPTHTYLPII